MWLGRQLKTKAEWDPQLDLISRDLLRTSFARRDSLSANRKSYKTRKYSSNMVSEAEEVAAATDPLLELHRKYRSDDACPMAIRTQDLIPDVGVERRT